MSWWAWLGLVLLAWALLGVGLSLFLGLGIGEADRRRPRRADPTPEDITGPGARPVVPAPRQPSRRRSRWARVGGDARPGGGAGSTGGEDGQSPPPTEDQP